MPLNFPYKPDAPIEKPHLVEVEADDKMTRLEAAAQAGDEPAFLAVQKTIDWEQRPPQDYIRAIQWALSIGAYLIARQLSSQGAERHPQHTELQKYARILAPPKVTRSDLPPDPTLRTNRDWLKTHRDAFKGQWVALHNGQSLGSAASLKSLTAQLGDTTDILLTKVF